MIDDLKKKKRYIFVKSLLKVFKKGCILCSHSQTYNETVHLTQCVLLMRMAYLKVTVLECNYLNEIISNATQVSVICGIRLDFKKM